MYGINMDKYGRNVKPEIINKIIKEKGNDPSAE
jgi:hypothetical protein